MASDRLALRLPVVLLNPLPHKHIPDDSQFHVEGTAVRATEAGYHETGHYSDPKVFNTDEKYREKMAKVHHFRFGELNDESQKVCSNLRPDAANSRLQVHEAFYERKQKSWRSQMIGTGKKSWFYFHVAGQVMNHDLRHHLFNLRADMWRAERGRDSSKAQRAQAAFTDHVRRNKDAIKKIKTVKREQATPTAKSKEKILELKHGLRHWKAQLAEIKAYSPIPTLDPEEPLPPRKMAYHQLGKQAKKDFWKSCWENKAIATNMYFWCIDTIMIDANRGSPVMGKIMCKTYAKAADSLYAHVIVPEQKNAALKESGLSKKELKQRSHKVDRGKPEEAVLSMMRKSRKHEGISEVWVHRASLRIGRKRKAAVLEDSEDSEDLGIMPTGSSSEASDGDSEDGE